MGLKKVSQLDEITEATDSDLLLIVDAETGETRKITRSDFVKDIESGSGEETDPVFTASEAANFEEGDVARLENTSGDNTGDQDLSGKVDKVTGSSLVPDTEIAKIHASGSDNQDLSGLVEKETGKSLVADTEIAKIHASGSDNQDLSGLQPLLTFGIQEHNAVEIDNDSVAENDFAKFTSAGLIGRSASETLSDIGAAPALGVDDNYVTDAEKGNLHAPGSDNQDLSGYQLISTFKRIVQLKIFDDASSLATGDGKLIFCIPSDLNGMNLVDADAFISSQSISGLPTVQIRNVTDSQDMLSTRITIDTYSLSSYVATTPPVIDASHDDVATGDLIAIDVDVAGAGSKGLGIILVFQL